MSCILKLIKGTTLPEGPILTALNIFVRAFFLKGQNPQSVGRMLIILGGDVI